MGKLRACSFDGRVLLTAPGGRTRTDAGSLHSSNSASRAIASQSIQVCRVGPNNAPRPNVTRLCSASKCALPKQHTAILMYHLRASLCISCVSWRSEQAWESKPPTLQLCKLPTLPRFPIAQLPLLETRIGTARSSMGGWTPDLIRSLWWETSPVRLTRDNLRLFQVCTSVPLHFLSTF